MMTLTNTPTLTLTWSGKAAFQSFYFSPSDIPDLFTAPQSSTDVLSVSPVTVDKAKFKYKKQIEDEICDGFFSGTLTIGYEDIDWEWDPLIEIESTEVDKNEIEDYLEDIAGAMLDGADQGTLQIQVPIDITLEIIAKSGNLAMGEITVECMHILDLYENCNFATDGKGVLFDEDFDIPGMALQAVKEAVIEMVMG